VRLRRLEFFQAGAGDHRKVSRYQGQDAGREKGNESGEKCGKRKWEAGHACLLYLYRFCLLSDKTRGTGISFAALSSPACLAWLGGLGSGCCPFLNNENSACNRAGGGLQCSRIMKEEVHGQYLEEENKK
jgi:hypothetical protein